MLSHKKSDIIIFPLLFFYSLLIIRTAWISDDAVITFRTIENFLAGYGLGYNPYVRVQAFTHPLWMFVVSFFYFLFRLVSPSSPVGLFNVVLFLSFGCSIAAIYLLLTKVFKSNRLSLILATLMLSLSNSFIDFSTSGLENPLTHLLLVVFIWVYYFAPDNLGKLSLLTALIALNRMDAFLLVFPALVYAWFVSEKNKRQLFEVFVGFMPLVLWELFSLVYYGFPFPNTAYAKLNTGIDKFLLMKQGMDYFLNAINWSPVTIFSIGVSGYIAIQSQIKSRALYLGVLLYLLYIVSIGGDFMSGRFFTASLIVSVAIISIEINNKYNQLILIAIVLLLGCFSPRSPLAGSDVKDYFPDLPIMDGNKISDERLFYIHEARSNGFVDNGFYETNYFSNFAGKKWYFVEYKKVVSTNLLGETGYLRGPNIYVTDEHALSDPLLARLPVQNKSWRIGHFYRDFPEGYLESLETNENKIVDSDLALYYSKLKIIITGRIWDWSRFVEIWKFNTGQYDYLLKNYLSKN